MTPSDAFVDVSDLAEELTPTQIQVAFRRSLKELSIPHGVNADGTTAFPDEVDYEFFQSETFSQVFERYLHEAVIEATVNSLWREGLIEKVWLDDQVQFGYRLKNDQ